MQDDLLRPVGSHVDGLLLQVVIHRWQANLVGQAVELVAGGAEAMQDELLRPVGIHVGRRQRHQPGRLTVKTG